MTLTAAVFPAGGHAAAAVSVWFESPLVAVGPDSPPAAFSPVWDGERITLKAAKGETESFLLVVRADAPRLVSWQVFDLVGLRGTIPGHTVDAFKALYIPVNEPARVGRYPDPLVPVVGHADAAADENLIIWFDISVPRDAFAGKYAGSFKVQWTGGEKVLPLEVTVWDFALSENGPLAILADLEPETTLKPYGLDPKDEGAAALLEKYTRLFAAHRIVAADVADLSPPKLAEAGGAVSLDWNPIAAKLAALYGNRGVPLLGAPWKAARGLSDEEARDYFRQVDRYYRERGWHARAFFDFRDAARSGGGEARRLAALARKEAPDIAVAIVSSLYPRSGIEAAAFNDAGMIETGFAEGDAYLAKRLAAVGKGMKVGYNAAPYIGAIGRAPVQSRLAGWAAWRWGASFLRVDGIGAFNKGMDPLSADAVASWPAGATPLLYPGADAAGAAPIPSMRLKLLRDGVEEYAYLNIIAEGGAAAFADELAATLLPAFAPAAEVDAAGLIRIREAAAIAAVKIKWRQGLGGDEFAGIVRDDTNIPVGRAVVRAGDLAALTDATGYYKLAYVPRGVPLVASAPGFERGGATAAAGRWDFALRPKTRRYLLHEATAKNAKIKSSGFEGGAVAKKAANPAGGACWSGRIDGADPRCELKPPITDWRTFGGMSLEALNAGGGGLTARVGFKDGAGRSWEKSFLLAPGEWCILYVPFPEKAGIAIIDVGIVSSVYMNFDGEKGTSVKVGRAWLTP